MMAELDASPPVTSLMSPVGAVAVAVNMVPTLESEVGEPCFAAGRAVNQGVQVGAAELRH